MTSRLTQREAAAQWGRGRATIQRAIRAGKLTPDSEGRIDPADLLRVFGEPGASRSDGPPKTTPEPPGPDPELSRLRAEVEALRAVVSAKDETIAAQGQTIAAMRLLTHDGAPRKRRWWPFSG